MQIGLSEASVLLRRSRSFGDPRLYALALVAEHLTHSSQPLVPEQMFVAGGGGATATARGGGDRHGRRQGLLGTLIGLLVAEKSGFHFDGGAGNGQTAALKELAGKMSAQAMESMKDAAMVAAANVAAAPQAPAQGATTVGLGKEGDRKLK